MSLQSYLDVFFSFKNAAHGNSVADVFPFFIILFPVIEFFTLGYMVKKLLNRIPTAFIRWSLFFNFFILFLCFSTSIFSQNRNGDRKMDSLIGLLPKSADTIKLKIYDIISNAYARSGEEAEKYAKDGFNLASKLNNRKYVILFLHTLGNIGCNESDNNKALGYYLEEIMTLQSYGADSSKMIAPFAGIGNVYISQNNYDKALHYFLCCLHLTQKKKLPNANRVGFLFQEIAVTYTGEKKYDEALVYLLQELNILMAEKNIDHYGLGKNYQGLGEVYYLKKEYAQALSYYDKALTEFKRTSQANELIGEIDNNLGNCFLGLKNYRKAIPYFQTACNILQGTQANGVQAESFEGLSVAYANSGEYKQAYENHLKYTQLQDTIDNAESRNQMNEMEAKYESANKDKEIAQKDAELKEQIAESKTKDANNKRQKAIMILFAFIAVAIAVIAAIILRSLRISRKQKSLIMRQKQEAEKQKGLVEEKNKDILDSITYAKRLQDAIIPPVSLIKKFFPDSFVLYRPKDIVAGDFYWMERLDDKIFIAACDCTGHGVPGAMVSVVCSNALNRALKEFKIRDTGKILNKTRELVLETFERSDGHVQDGMDCSICSIDTITKKVEWSGAYNPIWYIAPINPPDGSIDMRLVEIPADKQPVGKTDNPKPFTTQTINLEPPFGGQGSCGAIYLFTDGFADQFGGPKGKKFKYKQMQELIVAHSGKPMEEQGRILNEEIENWKGKLDQVDDILVIGIRIG